MYSPLSLPPSLPPSPPPSLSYSQAGDQATVKKIERALMTEEEREKAKYR